MSMQSRVQVLLDEAGTTFAAESGVSLLNKPKPLYRLLVLSVLLSTRIKAELAIAAARELSDLGTPERMFEATWQQRVDALDRAHYTRYDESTATALGRGAEMILDQYRGDLRRMRSEADGDVEQLHRALTALPRLGPVGADVFCREVQLVWPELRPYFDDKALAGADKLGLPTDPARLAELVEGHQLARLAAALVRTNRNRALAAEVTATA